MSDKKKPYLKNFKENKHSLTNSREAYEKAADSPEKNLICEIIRRASKDYLFGKGKQQQDAQEFFFGENLDVCKYYFSLLDLDYKDYVEDLKKLKKEFESDDIDIRLH